MSGNQLNAIRESFFTAVFSLLGHIANCDGYINRNEIKRTQVYMDRMDLSPKCRKEAIQLFRAGSSPRFNIGNALVDFKNAAHANSNIVQVLLVYLISMARTDGQLVEKEMEVVREVAKELGYSSIVFEHLLKMIVAQDQFSKTDSNGQHKQEKQESNSRNNKTSNQPADPLNAAFNALSVSQSASDADIKKAYRRLVSQFHPDKLVGQGMPTELVNAATERFKKIQSAYELIRKHRQMTHTA